jgi:hypothetical protein
MRVVAVPNDLHDFIHSKINEKLAGRPISAHDRECLYSELLAFYDTRGEVPDFEIVKNATSESPATAQGEGENT